MMRVPEVGCGFASIALRTTSEIRGIVLDERSRPKSDIRVEAIVAEVPEDEYSYMYADTDNKGQFTIIGIPEADVILCAGARVPETYQPYRRVYYPDSPSPETAARLRLKPGDVRTGISLRLAPPLQVRTVQVHVAFSDGLPAKRAAVRASVDGVMHEYARTASNGTAVLSCLDGIQYSVDVELALARDIRSAVASGSPFLLDCGSALRPIRLVLDHAVRGFSLPLPR